MRIFIGGVNGSGKTTLSKAVSIKTGIPVIHATTGFMKYVGFENDYDRLRAIPSSVRDTYLNQYMETLLKNNESFILDSHYLNLVKGKVTKVTGNWIGGFTALVLISTPIDDLWLRIQSDAKQRNRALFSGGVDHFTAKKSLLQYQTETREIFHDLAKEYDLPHIEIINHNGKEDSATRDLENFIVSFQ